MIDIQAIVIDAFFDASALAAWWPALVAYPVAAGAVWLGLSLAGAAWRARRLG